MQYLALCYIILLIVTASFGEEKFETVEILKNTVAGTMESSDAYVEIGPRNGKLDIQLESVVEKQFGEEIRGTIQDVLFITFQIIIKRRIYYERNKRKKYYRNCEKTVH